MRRYKIFLILLVVLAFPPAALSFYVPVEGGLTGLGQGNVQAIESEFRAMQQAAMLFRAEDPAGAGDLQEGENHIGRLSKYTDAPGHYSDTERYSLLVDYRGWWLGVAAPKADSMREYVINVAANNDWLGSSDTYTPPGNAAFGSDDEVVWKLFR